MAITIVDFDRLTTDERGAAARVLRDALAHMPDTYAGPGEAEAEVETRHRQPEWLGYAALDGAEVAGWIGAIRSYAHGWEIHPLVVAPRRQRQGIGSALLARIEARARAEGVITLYLGTDDEHGGTSLFGRDLYPDVLAHASAIAPTAAGHAFTFYRRHGYQVVGLLPDVNGPGRPDIYMAKRLAASPGSPDRGA